MRVLTWSQRIGAKPWCAKLASYVKNKNEDMLCADFETGHPLDHLGQNSMRKECDSLQSSSVFYPQCYHNALVICRVTICTVG